MAKRLVIITGDRKLNRMLSSLTSAKARALHRKAVRKAAKPILEQAKATAPVKSGALRRSLTIRATRRSRKSIGVQVTQKDGMFKGDQFYGGFQELGWKLGKRTSQTRRKAGSDKRKKIPGKWFMRGAGTEKQDEAIEIYESELKTFIESEARK